MSSWDTMRSQDCYPPCSVDVSLNAFIYIYIYINIHINGGCRLRGYQKVIVYTALGISQTWEFGKCGFCMTCLLDCLCGSNFTEKKTRMYRLLFCFCWWWWRRWLFFYTYIFYLCNNLTYEFPLTFVHKNKETIKRKGFKICLHLSCVSYFPT